MAFAVTVDRRECLNCGVCMDVCPVHSLDMTRPTGRSIEDWGPPKSWMMEYPIQVARCTGCQVCVMECPTQAIAVTRVAEEPAYAAVQGPVFTAPEPGDAWVPLSALTREGRKTARTDPWGSLAKWKPVRRQHVWQVWRTWPARLLGEPAAERH